MIITVFVCRTQRTSKFSSNTHLVVTHSIFAQAQQASLNPAKQSPGLIPGSNSRPADVFIPQFVDGRKIAFDVSVVSPTQDFLLYLAAQTPAAAIESRKSSKIRDNFDPCRTQGIFFQPSVVETFGGWDKDAILAISRRSRLRVPTDGEN